MIFENILTNKTVSVWGLGYLGYTTILKLQESGFNVVVHDFNKEQLESFVSGRYPNNNQKATWSLSGFLPKLDYSNIKVARDIRDMFKHSHAHFIAIPTGHNARGRDDVADRVVGIFAKNLKRSAIVPLVIFESAFIPGNVQKTFVNSLKKEKIIASRDYYISAFFRTDWNIEAFIAKKDRMPVSGYCQKSSEAIKKLLDYMGIPAVALDSIKDAEIYVNSINVIQSMTNDFIRQLAIGYPSVNMKKLSKILFSNVSLDDCVLNIGTGGAKMTFSTDYLIEGSDNPGSLTLLKEFQNINISSVLSYADFIIRRGYKSVSILGITYKGNQKDLTLSPSVTLADYLIKNGVEVFICDPYCTAKEIHKYIKGVKVVAFPGKIFSADVVVVASDHNQYKYTTTERLRAVKNRAKLIIDNYGIWGHMRFGSKTKYYQVGDGSLDLSK